MDRRSRHSLVNHHPFFILITNVSLLLILIMVIMVIKNGASARNKMDHDDRDSLTCPSWSVSERLNDPAWSPSWSERLQLINDLH